MFKQYQRLFLIGLIAVSLTVTVVLFVVGEHNPSVASDTAGVVQPQPELPYFNTIDHIPTENHAQDKYTVLLFTASWDSYSQGMVELMRTQLAHHANLQVVELDISTYRTEADKHQVVQPPMAILLDREGTELARTSTATSGGVEKLLNLLPRN